MNGAPLDAKRIVVKVGSSLVTNQGRGVDAKAVGDWCRQMAELVRHKRDLVMVSSGAIAEGMAGGAVGAGIGPVGAGIGAAMPCCGTAPGGGS